MSNLKRLSNISQTTTLKVFFTSFFIDKKEIIQYDTINNLVLWENLKNFIRALKLI